MLLLHLHHFVHPCVCLYARWTHKLRETTMKKKLQYGVSSFSLHEVGALPEETRACTRTLTENHSQFSSPFSFSQKERERGEKLCKFVNIVWQRRATVART